MVEFIDKERAANFKRLLKVENKIEDKIKEVKNLKNTLNAFDNLALIDRTGRLVDKAKEIKEFDELARKLARLKKLKASQGRFVFPSLKLKSKTINLLKDVIPKGYRVPALATLSLATLSALAYRDYKKSHKGL